MEFSKEEIMKTLRIAGLLVFALTGFAIADEAKSAPKNIPDFDVQGVSMTEWPVAPRMHVLPVQWSSRSWKL